ncbi:hypothetical protein [Agromyces sp. ZXT2-6]|uniref:hypothetical protein n=1 Tax=Agromyces sp. ZXT2-6 TaxID=3461153 RepID=UPI004054AF9C
MVTTLEKMTGLGMLRVTCRANTVSLVSSAAADRMMLTMSDMAAAGWAVSSLRVRPTRMRVKQSSREYWWLTSIGEHEDSERDSSFRVQKGPARWTRHPVVHLRRKVVRTSTLSYSNPLEGQFLVPDAGGQGKSMAEALRVLLLAGPERVKARAEAKLANLDAIQAEALADESIDEAFYRKQQAHQEFRLRQQEYRLAEAAIERARLENESLLLDVATRAHELSKTIAADRGTPEAVVGFDAMKYLLDNSRLLGSIRIAREIDMEVQVEEIPEDGFAS